MSLLQFIDEFKRVPYSHLINSINTCVGCEFCDKEGLRDIGEGFVPADVMFIGEAEGEIERKNGRPFIGDAGEVIRRTWNKNGFVFGNNDLNGGQIKSYVSNSICCWPYPPESSKARNGKPTKESLEACKSWLWQKIKMVQPMVVVGLGTIATKHLLSIDYNDSKWKISDHIDEWQERDWPPIGKVQIVPAYHPSFVLRQGSPKNLLELYDKILERVKNYLNSSIGNKAANERSE